MSSGKAAHFLQVVLGEHMDASIALQGLEDECTHLYDGGERKKEREKEREGERERS